MIQLVTQAIPMYSIDLSKFVAAIQKIPLPFTPKEDRLMWIKDPKGHFFVKSVIKTNQELDVAAYSNIKWTELWKLKLNERVKMLIWRIGSNIIPTKKNMTQRLGDIDLRCPFCNEEEESTIHLFCKCLVSRSLRYSLKCPLSY